MKTGCANIVFLSESMNISSIQFVLSTGNYLRYKQMKIIIIGGVAGGATTAARIRRVDETAEIVLLEKGKYISYANCGLPLLYRGSDRGTG